MNRFRTSTSPSCGDPTSTEAMVKFRGTGMPCGRDAKRISRLIMLPIVCFFSRQNHATAYQVRQMGLSSEGGQRDEVGFASLFKPSSMNHASTFVRAHGVLRRNVRLDFTLGLN